MARRSLGDISFSEISPFKVIIESASGLSLLLTHAPIKPEVRLFASTCSLTIRFMR